MTEALSATAHPGTQPWHVRDSRRGPDDRQTKSNNRIGPEFVGDVIDSAIRTGSPHRGRMHKELGLEWALIDTRGSDSGSYLLRGWTDAYGVSRPVERPPSPRRGGAITLFTLDDRCVSVGPSPPFVDEGAGLLLLGFARMAALPLPTRGAETLEANWLLILSHRDELLSASRLDHLLLRLWAVFDAFALGGVEFQTLAPVRYPATSQNRHSA